MLNDNNFLERQKVCSWASYVCYLCPTYKFGKSVPLNCGGFFEGLLYLCALGKHAERAWACSASEQNELERARRVRGTKLSVLGEYAKYSRKSAKIFSENRNNSKHIRFIWTQFLAKLAVYIIFIRKKFRLSSYNTLFLNTFLVFC